MSAPSRRGEVSNPCRPRTAVELHILADVVVWMAGLYTKDVKPWQHCTISQVPLPLVFHAPKHWLIKSHMHTRALPEQIRPPQTGRTPMLPSDTYEAGRVKPKYG